MLLCDWEKHGPITQVALLQKFVNYTDVQILPRTKSVKDNF